MSYDHRKEVADLRRLADKNRQGAAQLRASVELTYQNGLRNVADSLAYARRLDAQADSTHRLCSRGAEEPCCGMLPGSVTRVGEVGTDTKKVEESTKLVALSLSQMMTMLRHLRILPEPSYEEAALIRTLELEVLYWNQGR